MSSWMQQAARVTVRGLRARVSASSTNSAWRNSARSMVLTRPLVQATLNTSSTTSTSFQSATSSWGQSSFRSLTSGSQNPSWSYAGAQVLDVVTSTATRCMSTGAAGGGDLSEADEGDDDATINRARVAADQGAGGDGEAGASDSQPPGPKDSTEGDERDFEEEKSIAEYQAALEKAEGDAKQYKEKLVRALADLENLRMRSAQNVENAHKFGIQKFASALLEVSDNMDRALTAVEERARADDADKTLVELFEGLVLTQNGLHKTFNKFDIVKMESMGVKSDPNLHDVLYEYDDPNSDPFTVGQIVKEGYFLKDRVLRPAQVGTVRGRPEEESQEAATAE